MSAHCVCQLIDFLPSENPISPVKHMFTENTTFHMLKNKFHNQIRGSLHYHQTKYFLLEHDLVDIPVEFYNDRDLFEQILDKGHKIQDLEKWFKIWMKDYEIMRKIAISSGYWLTKLIKELKKHNKEPWFRDLTDDFSFWTSYFRIEFTNNCQHLNLASKRIRNNIEMMKTLISIQADSFFYMDEKFKKNSDLIKAACEHSGSFFQYLPSNMLTKEMVIRIIEKKSCFNMKYIPKKMWDFEIATAIAKHLPGKISDIPLAFLTKEIVMLAIGQNGCGYAFHQIKDCYLKKDEELSLMCIRNGGSIEYLDKSIKFNKNIVATAVECNELVYLTIPDFLQDDLDVCLSVLKRSGCILYEMPDSVKSNRSIILQAVKTSANALYYVPKEYLSDREVILTAFSSGFFHFDYDILNQHIPNSKRLERNQHLSEREKFPPLIDLIQREEFLNDREVILHIVKHFPSMLSLISDENLINDREFLQECLKMNGNCFEFIPNHFKFDYDLCSIALKNYRNSIIHFPIEVQMDRRIFNSLIENLPLDGQARTKLAKELKTSVTQHEYWFRKDVHELSTGDGHTFDIVDCHLLAQLRRERLEKHYFGCHVPIKQ